MSVPLSQYAIQGISAQPSDGVEMLIVSDERELQRESNSRSEYVVHTLGEQASEEIERLMIFREKELRAERDSLEINYKRALATCEELSRKAKQAEILYKCVADELEVVKLDRENKLAKMIEELAKKDEEFKKMKEEKEATIAEMAEKLAKKEQEFDELWTDRNTVVEDLVGRVLFLQDQITKEYGLDNYLHKKSDERDSAIVGENGGFEVQTMQNPVNNQVESDHCVADVQNLLNGSKEHLEKATLDTSSHNQSGAANPNTSLEGEHIASQASSKQAVGEKTLLEPAEPSKSVENRQSPTLQVIDIIDNEDEGRTKSNVSTFPANGSNQTLKRERSTPLVPNSVDQTFSFP